MKKLNLRSKRNRVINFFEKSLEEAITLSQLRKFLVKEGILLKNSIDADARYKIYPARNYMEKYRENTIAHIAPGTYKLGDKGMDNLEEAERRGKRIGSEAKSRRRVSKTIKIKTFLPSSQPIIQELVIRMQQDAEQILFLQARYAENRALLTRHQNIRKAE